MALDSSKVIVGSPYEGVNSVGAIYDAPTTATAPTSAISELSTTGTDAWRNNGYVSEDGLELTQEWSTNDIYEWGGSLIRKALETFTGQVTYSDIQVFDEVTLKRAYGDSNITVTAATAEHGAQLKAQIGAELPPERSYCFNMKDGDTRVRIYIPRGQVTAIDTISFKNSEVVALPVTLDGLADSSGKCIYLFSDDGQKTAAFAADKDGNVYEQDKKTKDYKKVS